MKLLQYNGSFRDKNGTYYIIGGYIFFYLDTQMYIRGLRPVWGARTEPFHRSKREARDLSLRH